MGEPTIRRGNIRVPGPPFSAVLLSPAATAHVVFSIGAIVAGGQASVLPSVSLTLSALAIT